MILEKPLCSLLSITSPLNLTHRHFPIRHIVFCLTVPLSVLRSSSFTNHLHFLSRRTKHFLYPGHNSISSKQEISWSGTIYCSKLKCSIFFQCLFTSTQLNALPFKNYARGLHTVKVSHFPLPPFSLPPSADERWNRELQRYALTLPHFSCHAEIRAKGHLGHMDQPHWATSSFSSCPLSGPPAVHANEKSFPQEESENAARAGVRQESCGLEQLQAEHASSELGSPRPQPMLWRPPPREAARGQPKGRRRPISSRTPAPRQRTPRGHRR